MYDINIALKDTIKMIESLGRPITREEIKLYGFDILIHSLTNRKPTKGTDCLFDFGEYQFDNTKGMGIIKVSNDIIWFIEKGNNVKIPTSTTPEELFMNSLNQNYGDLGIDIVNDCMRLVELLEHLQE